MTLDQLASPADYRLGARRRLPRLLFDYIDGGAFDEVTMARNRADMANVRLRQRVMRGLGGTSLTTDLFGDALAMPVALGPVGFAGMFARRGEVAAARAARAAGIPFTLSTVGICDVDEVTAGAAPPWFQLYMIRDRGFMRELLSRAHAAGCRALVVTVDLPAPAPRYRDIRSGMSARQRIGGLLRQAVDGAAHPAWMVDVWLRGRPHAFGNLDGAFDARRGGFASAWTWIRDNFDASVGWRDLDFVRANWPGHIVIKGIMDSEDALLAADAGADAVVVSNHGGRQLDSAASSISALPRVVDAAGGRLPVLFDGGIRGGLDVLKALALGAHTCLLGRAWAFALAAGGEAGVARLLAQIRAELATALVLTGCADVRSAGRHLLDLDAPRGTC